MLRSNPELYAKTHDFSKARKAGLWLFLKIVFFLLLHKEVEINETLIKPLHYDRNNKKRRAHVLGFF